MVLAKETNLRDLLRGLAPSIRVDALSKVMVKVALNGFENDTLENAMIKRESNQL